MRSKEPSTSRPGHPSSPVVRSSPPPHQAHRPPPRGVARPVPATRREHGPRPKPHPAEDGGDEDAKQSHHPDAGLPPRGVSPPAKRSGDVWPSESSEPPARPATPSGRRLGPPSPGRRPGSAASSRS